MRRNSNTTLQNEIKFRQKVFQYLKICHELEIKNSSGQNYEEINEDKPRKKYIRDKNLPKISI